MAEGGRQWATETLFPKFETVTAKIRIFRFWPNFDLSFPLKVAESGRKVRSFTEQRRRRSCNYKQPSLTANDRHAIERERRRRPFPSEFGESEERDGIYRLLLCPACGRSLPSVFLYSSLSLPPSSPSGTSVGLGVRFPLLPRGPFIFRPSGLYLVSLSKRGFQI